MSSHGHAFTIADGVACAPPQRPPRYKRPMLVASLSFAIMATIAYDLLLLAAGL